MSLLRCCTDDSYCMRFQPSIRGKKHEVRYSKADRGCIEVKPDDDVIWRSNAFILKGVGHVEGRLALWVQPKDHIRGYVNSIPLDPSYLYLIVFEIEQGKENRKISVRPLRKLKLSNDLITLCTWSDSLGLVHLYVKRIHELVEALLVRDSLVDVEEPLTSVARLKGVVFERIKLGFSLPEELIAVVQRDDIAQLHALL